METLNNFNLIYCFIAFIIAEVFILFIITKEQKNKVKFFVTKQSDYCGLKLFLGRPTWNENISAWVGNKGAKLLATDFTFKFYNLNPDDFTNMRCGEIMEVVLNLED